MPDPLRFQQFDMLQVMSPAFGVLYYYLGILLEHARRNWFVGIRTPWTLSSDVVWNETRRRGGQLFKVAGVVAILGGLFSGYLALLCMLVPVLLVAIYTVVYSYFAYQRLAR